MNNCTYTYYFNVPVMINGSKFPFVDTKQLTRDQFIEETGIDPITNKCIYTYLLYIYTFIN